MKIVPIDQVKYGMSLEQNIYRHDGLLCLPKGVMIKTLEQDMLNYYQIQFLQVSEPKVRELPLDETVAIIRQCYMDTTLWSRAFGEELFRWVEKLIRKYKKIQSYLVELRRIDSYSFAQCINISIVMTKLLCETERPDKGLGKIAFLSLVHDVGRIEFKSLFNKKGRLSEEEFQQLQQHPENSYHLLKKAGLPDGDIYFVLQTHETVMGTGYPNKLRGDEILPMAQLILLADLYNALSSYRPHREAFSPAAAMAVIQEERGKMIGSTYVDLFLRRFAPYQEGNLVEFNNGLTGRIKRVVEKRNLFPIVDVLSDTTGEVHATVDLHLHRDLRIVKILQSY